MAISDTDLFLIDDAGTSKKILAGKLKAGLTGTYANMKLLVNKADYSSRWVYCKDLQTNLPADHWLMVESRGQSYKVNGTDILNYFPSGPAGATGVITDSHTTPITQGSTGTHDLTVASLATPNFADNEAIRMVDNNGDTASYTPVTSTITHVDNIVADYSSSLTCPTGFAAPATNGFNGKTETASGDFSGQTCAFTYSPPFEHSLGTWQWSSELSFSTLKIYALCHKATVVSSNPGVREVLPLRVKNATSGWIDLSGFIGEDGSGNMNFENIDTGVDVTDQVAALNGKIDGLQFQNDYGAYGWGLWGIEIDGYLLVDGALENLLTFADPCPDLKFFQPQDVVQPGRSFDMGGGTATCPTTPSGEFGTSTDINAVMNGELGIENSVHYNNSVLPVSITCTPNNPIPDGATLTVLYSYGNVDVTVNNNFAPTITKANGTPVSIIPTDVHHSTSDPGQAAAEIKFNTGYQVDNFEITFHREHTYNIVLVGFVEEPIAEEAKVISRDLVARTMLVDGGAWLGSDGTNSGVAANQETEVTGPSKSGTAKTDGIPPSETFRIKDSNGQWIDNTNSNSGADHSGASAQKFYVKNGSGRVSIARLLETALTEATAWQAATGYAEGAFVEHDGVYWYALSSSYDNSPDDNDPLDWLRLS